MRQLRILFSVLAITMVVSGCTKQNTPSSQQRTDSSNEAKQETFEKSELTEQFLLDQSHVIVSNQEKLLYETKSSFDETKEQVADKVAHAKLSEVRVIENNAEGTYVFFGEMDKKVLKIVISRDEKKEKQVVVVTLGNEGKKKN